MGNSCCKSAKDGEGDDGPRIAADTKADRGSKNDAYVGSIPEVNSNDVILDVVPDAGGDDDDDPDKTAPQGNHSGTFT